MCLIGVGRGASTKQLIAYLKAQMKKAEPYTRMKLMAVGLQVRKALSLSLSLCTCTCVHEHVYCCCEDTYVMYMYMMNVTSM